MSASSQQQPDSDNAAGLASPPVRLHLPHNNDDEGAQEGQHAPEHQNGDAQEALLWQSGDDAGKGAGFGSVPAPSASPPPLSIVRTEKNLGRRQLWAMLRKNVLIKRRAWGQTCCECFAPLVLTLLILVGWQLSARNATTTPPTIYANQTIDLSSLLTQANGLASLVNLTALAQDGANAFIGGGGGGGAATPSFAPPSASQAAADGLNGGALGGLINQLVSYSGPLPVPTLDTFIGAHDLLHGYLTGNNDSSTLEAANRLSIADSRFNVLVNLGKISFAPDTPDVRAIVAQMNESHASFDGAFDAVYPTEDAAVAHALRDFTLDPTFDQRDPYRLRSWALIVFDELDLRRGRIDYSVRMNYSVVASTRRKSARFKRGYDNTYQRYFLSGYLTLQMTVEQALVDVSSARGYLAPSLNEGGMIGSYRNQSGARGQIGSLLAIPLPVSSAFSNPFYDSSGPFVGLVLCMSLLYPVSRLIKVLVEDKESRMKETLKMSGLYNWVFVTSYGITYFFIFTFIALLQTILMGSSVMQHSSKVLLFVFFWFFALSMLCLSFLISVFFSKAKLAGIVGPIVCFALIIPRYAFLTTEDDEQLGAKFLLCIFSPTAYAFAMDNYMLYEGAQQGITSRNAGAEPLSVSAMVAFMFFDGVAYALLAWWFEQVLPNEYGTARRPWFLFQKSYWRESKPQQQQQLEAGALENMDPQALGAREEQGSHIEPIRDPELRSKARVVISHLRKVFTHGNGLLHACSRQSARAKSETVAVKDLSLTMYEGQITCLLGHNGAGKSTTISMLTGLFKPTSGNAFVNGYSLQEQMPQIRHHLGICPQHNVLFDTLTVKEHLELFAVLKGTPSEQIPEAVQKQIEDVGLTAKTDVYSSALSGGMKRKLSVSMALIGDSRVCYLDEPTSGMDPYSRRSTWELLKRAKVGRVIVLTTHFMDEADLLADRIAIMSSGQLRACGSSLFLKSQFGIGYSLTLVYKREVAQQIADEAQRSVSPMPRPLLAASAAEPNAVNGVSSELAEPLLAAEHDALHRHAPAAAAAPVITAWTQPQVHSFLRRFVPETKALSQAAGEISFQLPLSAVSRFAELFNALDASKEQMGIASYGISMTKLEEVFIKLAHEEEQFRPKELGGEYVRDKEEDRAEKEARALVLGGGAAAASLPAACESGSASAAEGNGNGRMVINVSPAPSHSSASAASGSSSSPEPDGIEMSSLAAPSNQGQAGGDLRIPTPSQGQGEGAGTEVAASAAVAPGELDGAGQTNGHAAVASASSVPAAASSAAAAGAGAGAGAGVGSSIVFPPAANGERLRHTAPMGIQVRELFRKRYLCAKRDLLGRLYEVVLPVIIVALVLLILTVQFNPAGPSMEMSSAALYGGDRWTEPSSTTPAEAAAQTQSRSEVTAEEISRRIRVMASRSSPSSQHQHSHAHDALNLVVSPGTLYYPSYSLLENVTLPSGDEADFGLTPVSVPASSTRDNGLIYALGLANPGPRSRNDPLPVQPFVLDVRPGVPDSLNLSVSLLEDLTNHAGNRVGAYVFDDRVRIITPLTSDQASSLVAAVLASTGFLPAGLNASSVATLAIPLQFQDIDGVLSLLNVTSLVDLAQGANISNIAIPGLDGTASAVLDDEGELTVVFPPFAGAAAGAGGTGTPFTFNINLNTLSQNLTSRVPGTNNTFSFQGIDLTLPPGAVDAAANSLNLTQLLTALQENFVNGTFPAIDVPIGALIGGISNATLFALATNLLDGLGLGVINAPLSLMHNVSAWHAIPSFASDLFRARLELMYSDPVQRLAPDSPLQDFAAALPAYGPRVSYRVRNHPLPLTTQTFLTIRAILAIFAALFVLIPFCYLPASFVIFVVKERSCKAKHLQLVSGVSQSSYWLSTFLFDMANYALVCVAVILVFIAYQNESFTGDSGTTFATFLLFLLYGFAVVPLAYCLSFMFNNHTAAQVGIASLLFVLGFVLTIGAFILSSIETTRDANEALKPFYRLSPPYCLGEGMINLATRSLIGLIAGRKQSVWDWDVTGRLLVYLVCESVGYFALTLFIEFALLKKGYKILVRKVQGLLRGSNHKGAQASGGAGGAQKPPRAAMGPDGIPEDEQDSAVHDGHMSAQPSLHSGNGHSVGGNEKLFQERSPSVSRQGQPNNAALAAEHSRSRNSKKASPRAVGQGVPLGSAEFDSEQKQSSVLAHPSRDISLQAGAVEVDMSNRSSRILPSGHSPAGVVPQQSFRTLASIAKSSGSGAALAAEDDDVAFERQRVESGSADKDLIVIKHLRKTFGFDGVFKIPFLGRTVRLPFLAKPMVAVQDLSLAVPAGQVFGFLGVNGAGKTTTMAMLTGELEPDAGQAFLNGFDVVTQKQQVRQELGYCPQFDPLLDLMTAREHLLLYGRIRGIPEGRLGELSEHLISKLGLTPFADNISETYSGGNKRKLSLALALVGSPSVVFLDEPSTGMDPVSRRFMWDIIADLSRTMSIVLTTHSMEECEALCSRVTIIVNGQLACIGSLEHLKNKYGKGYSLEISADEKRMDDIRSFVQELFQGAEEQEQHSGRIQYLIPTQREGLSLAMIFGRIEARKEALGIHDYSVSQASLESIFVQIAKGQDPALAEHRGNHAEVREAKR